MARFALGLVTGATIMLVVGAALGVHARDEVDMSGQADLTGVDGSSEVISPTSAEPDLTVESPPAQLTGVWRLLAHCESTLNPRAVSPGGTYRGLFQFDQQTWTSVGGLAFAPRADLASTGDQLVAAQRLQARRGWAPWPWCSRHLGLR
jgi:hypothetical protein